MFTIGNSLITHFRQEGKYRPVAPLVRLFLCLLPVLVFVLTNIWWQVTWIFIGRQRRLRHHLEYHFHFLWWLIIFNWKYHYLRLPGWVSFRVRDFVILKCCFDVSAIMPPFIRIRWNKRIICRYFGWWLRNFLQYSNLIYYQKQEVVLVFVMESPWSYDIHREDTACLLLNIFIFSTDILPIFTLSWTITQFDSGHDDIIRYWCRVNLVTNNVIGIWLC